MMGISLLGIAQTATDFTAEDCNAVSYNLFSELDSGKVVAIVWTMPCGACVSGALTTYNIVQSFKSSYPNRVKMLVADDFGNTPCSSINSWTNSNGMTGATKFSNASIAMADYGIAGMPKVVVVGGTDHAVYYNTNNVVDPVALEAAINAALTTTAIDEVSRHVSAFNIYPNPATNTANVIFTLNQNAKISLHLCTLDGQVLQVLYDGNCEEGEKKIPVDITGYSSGLYLIKVTEAGRTKTVLLNITH
jgi:hypothetical protein